MNVGGALAAVLGAVGVDGACVLAAQADGSGWGGSEVGAEAVWVDVEGVADVGAADELDGEGSDGHWQ